MFALFPLCSAETSELSEPNTSLEEFEKISATREVDLDVQLIADGHGVHTIVSVDA